MTSRFATNFKEDNLTRVRYLRVNTEGQPLQGQVPLTYQIYNGVGNETIAYDGSDIFCLTSVLSAGDLTIDFSDMANHLGRTVQFLVEKQLSNDCNLDFGTGSLYVPPLTSPLSSTSLTPSRSPTASILTFYEIDKAMIVSNPTVSPSNITPGDPGQVLTTNIGTGTVGWENPAGPKCLTFKVSDDPANDLNGASLNRIQWEDDPVKNDTTLIPTAGSIPGTVASWEVADLSVYDISADLFIVSDPSTAYKAFIAINGDMYCYKESTLGLTGQTLSMNLKIKLNPTDLIGVYCGNATGPIVSTAPTSIDNGLICITQSVY